MSHDAELRCRCGEIAGRVRDPAPQSVNRVICYCDDCQAYLHHLGRTDLLDEHGGTDVIQVAASSLSFQRGAERIVGLRLSPKGPYRFYTSCCQTPLGNMVSPAIPFIGIVAQGFQGADDCFGKPIGEIYGQYAIGSTPPGSDKLNLRLMLRVIRLMLSWRLGGKAWPHPFFDRTTGASKYPVTTLTPAEREALRPLCGPRPAAR